MGFPLWRPALVTAQDGERRSDGRPHTVSARGGRDTKPCTESVCGMGDKCRCKGYLMITSIKAEALI